MDLQKIKNEIKDSNLAESTKIELYELIDKSDGDLGSLLVLLIKFLDVAHRFAEEINLEDL